MSGVEIVKTTSSSSSSDKSWTVSCPTGKTVIGGGASFSSGANVTIVQNEPGPLTSGKATTWVVRGEEVVNESGNWSITAQVICATAG